MAKSVQIIPDSDLKKFGDVYVKLLTVFLKKEYKYATGSLINSIDYRLQRTAEDINIVIIANDYLKYVNDGRKPGSYPPIQAISKWASVKGISQDAVFPIARSIFKFGIKPTNVIQKTIKEIQTSPTLNKRLEKTLVDNIEKVVKQEFDKNNK
jgi:hypothetical protein